MIPAFAAKIDIEIFVLSGRKAIEFTYDVIHAIVFDITSYLLQYIPLYFIT